jgi:hypothetical protein
MGKCDSDGKENDLCAVPVRLRSWLSSPGCRAAGRDDYIHCLKCGCGVIRDSRSRGDRASEIPILGETPRCRRRRVSLTGGMTDVALNEMNRVVTGLGRQSMCDNSLSSTS